MPATIGGKVKLDGEAEYRKALKDINGEVKTLQSEMKAASSSFDENATAEEKAQKSADLLAKAMEEQQKKIDLISDRLSKANDAYGEGSSETQKYRKELADAQVTMGKMKDEADKLENGVDDVGKAEEDATEKTSTFGDTLRANLTADAITNGLSAIKDGIVDIAQSSVEAWHDVDDGMDVIVTKTGASGDALADMQQRAKDIATSIPTDFETAGTAIGEVNTRFGLTGDALSELSQQFIEFANINNTDVNSSIDTVQTALDAFGLSSDNAGAMLDALNVAGQNSGASMDTLAQELTSNATAFQSMGFSAQDSINLLSTLEKSGVDTSTVLTGLSKVQQKAAKDGVSMQDEFTKAVSSSQDAIDIFGSKAGPKLYQAFQNGTLSVEDFTAANASLDESLGSVSTTYEATLDPLDQVTVAQNKLAELQANLVDTIMPALLPLIEEAGDYVSQIDISGLQEKIASIDFTGLIDAIKSVADASINIINFVVNNGPLVVGVLGTIGAAMVGMKIADFVSSISGVISTVGTLVPALGGVVTALGPVGIAIGAAVTAGVLLYQNWDTIKEKAKELGNKIKDAWDGIKKKTSEVWENVKQTVSEKWEGIRTAVANSKIGQAASTVWEAAKKTTTDALSSIRSAYDEHGGGMTGAVAAVGETIKQSYTAGYNFINNLTGGKLGEMLSTVKSKMSDVASNVSEKLEKVKGYFTDKLGSALSTVTSKFGDIASKVQDKMGDIKQHVSDGLEKVKGFFSNTKLELPEIKLPHFKVEGKLSLNPISVPHISVDWYAKAMQSGTILDNPTIFGANNGKLLGAGEAGPEVVVGASSLKNMISDAVRATNNSMTINVYGTEGQDVNELAQIVADRINIAVDRRQRAFA